MCSSAAPSWYLPDSSSCSTKPTSRSVRRMPWTVPLGRPSSPASSPTPSRRDLPDRSRRIAAALSIDWMEPGTGPDLAQRFRRGAQEQVARGRPRVLMADAARSEVARTTPAGFERDRGLHPLLGCVGRALQRVAELAALPQRLDRGQQPIDHRLVTRLRLPTRLHALDTRLDGCCPAVEVELTLARGGRAHLQEQGSVQRAGRAADAGDQRHADVLEVGTDVAALRAVELLDDLLHPAVQVRAVVAIADRGVEAHELHALLGHHVGEATDPIAYLLGCHAPHRSAGVRTGASHSRVISSSSLSSVIEQPAISSEVM